MGSFVALTKSEAAYQELRARILDGRLAPGARVSTEALAEDLNISTTPLREAVRRLAADYLLEAPPHREILIPPLTTQRLQEIYELRLILDPLAAGKATTQARDEDVRAVRGLLEAARTAQPAEWLAANRRFHRGIYSRCGNQILVRALDTLTDRSDRYLQVLSRGVATVARADKDHDAIMDAFAGGKPREVEALVREHLRTSLDYLVSALAASSADANGAVK